MIRVEQGKARYICGPHTAVYIRLPDTRVRFKPLAMATRHPAAQSDCLDTGQIVQIMGRAWKSQ